MLNRIFNLILISFSILSAQSSFFFQPSFYFTYGVYSNSSSSQQYSLYTSFSWNNYDYFVIGYDYIKISNRSNIISWDYKQNNFSGGLHYWLNDLNLKLKTDFVLVDGKYKDNYINQPLLEKGYLISPEIISGIYPFYYGAGYSFFRQKANNNFYANQFYLRADYYPHYKVLLNGILSAHLISDGRKQTSLQFSAFYFPFYELSIKGSFTIGARSIFYNPDLMVLYNQLETQTSNYSIQLNYNFYKNLVVIFQYQRSKFTSYNIDYFVIGLKSPIYF